MPGEPTIFSGVSIERMLRPRVQENARADLVAIAWTRFREAPRSVETYIGIAKKKLP